MSDTTLPFLPFARPDIGDAEIAAVTEALRSGWVTTGPKARAFEQAFTDYLGGNGRAERLPSTPPPPACTWRWRRSAWARATR